MDWNDILKVVESTIAGVGLQVLGAIILYAVGRRLIGFAVGLAQKGLIRQNFEPTLLRFIATTISVILNITLVIAILGYFGVQTTSFAALLASAGLAIGSAWGGLLSNFAAGIYLVVMRPFKVGEFISAGGVTGTVEAVGLFVTTIDTPDNLRTFVGNNKLFSDNIQNFSTNPYRRVDLTATVSGAVDPKAVIAALKEKIKLIPNVLEKPEPEVGIAKFTEEDGFPVLAIRPYTTNDSYWQVYFDTNMVIQEVLGDRTPSAPMPVREIDKYNDAAPRE